MKVAVTAASGKLGSAIVNELKKEIGPENITAIVRNPDKASHLGIEIKKGDYNSKEDLISTLNGINALLLISGMDTPEKRITQHRNVIEAAKLNGVEKIVYTSIIGQEEGTSFSPIVKSNRQTEEDIKKSSLDWVIGRNGIYIEPDLEYIENYIAEGEIRNCAGNGKCCYTSRKELAVAYTKMLIQEKHNCNMYNLVGEPVTQYRLAQEINLIFGTNLIYNPISFEEYEKERKAVFGDFIGGVITGIYDGINKGVYDVPSHFEKAAGRPHKTLKQMIEEFYQSNNKNEL